MGLNFSTSVETGYLNTDMCRFE